MVERWVGDKLHDILGISDKHVAQYLIGLAGKASSSEDFVRRLKDTGTVEVDTNMVNFCNELWNKVRNLRLLPPATVVNHSTHGGRG